MAYFAFTFAVSLLSHGHAARIIQVPLNCFTAVYERHRTVQSTILRRSHVEKKARIETVFRKIIEYGTSTSPKTYLRESLIPFYVDSVKFCLQISLRRFGSSCNHRTQLCEQSVIIYAYASFFLIEIRMYTRLSWNLSLTRSSLSAFITRGAHLSACKSLHTRLKNYTRLMTFLIFLLLFCVNFIQLFFFFSVFYKKLYNTKIYDRIILIFYFYTINPF